MKLMLKTVGFAVLLILAVVFIFQWATQPTGMHDASAGQRVCTAFLGVSWLLFFGVIVAVAMMKIK